MSNTDSSDEEDMVVLQYLKRRRRRKYWVHPYLEKNIRRRLFVAAKELEQTDAKFVCFYRMSKESYLDLEQLIGPAIRQRNTNMRECVSYEERLLITLRYLATGATFASLALYFCRGESTIGNIVAETTTIIWNVLKEEYMSLPNQQQWQKIADRFESLWNLPHCIGALDGKHVRIEKFPNTGSTNFNYKSYHSVVLLACCDANGFFTTIETGFAGRNSDGGIFRASAMRHWITNNGLDIPSPSPLRYDQNACPFPYYFVADEAFPLSHFLMRPYPQRVLDNVKRIFNYRLSRGRKTIECAFGMAAEKFAILNGPIRCRDPEKVTNIIKAACVLHNYVRKREGLEYVPRNSEGTERSNYSVIPPEKLLPISYYSTGEAVRNYLANYFLTPQASLP